MRDPRRIGSYRIEEVLGRGGMGEVYRAYDETLERQVAIKLVRTADMGSSTSRERFRREARTVAALDHPSVVRVHHLERWEDLDCIVMEHVEGRTLAALLRDGRLELDEAVRLSREVVEGLAAAHAQGIVHRDLKAENVMVTPDGRAKILDFGLAKRLQPRSGEVSLSEDGRIVGTFHSMSPEQAQGHAVDHRSDLFSFGTLLYQLTTGRRPFSGDQVTEVLAQVCMRRQIPARELDPTVPAELSEWIDRLLEKRPEDRPQTASEVAAALARLDADATRGSGVAKAPAVPSASGGRSVGEWLGHHRRWVVVAVVVMVSGLLWTMVRETTQRIDPAARFAAAEQHEARGELDDALTLAREVVQRASASGDRRLEAEAWQLQVYVLDRMGRPQEGMGAFEKASALFDLLDDAEARDQLFAYTATILIQVGELDKARAVFERLYGSYRDKGDAWNAARWQVNYAGTLDSLGYPADAIPLFRQALDVLGSFEDEENVAKVQLNLGTALHQLERLDDALVHYETSRLTFAKLDDRASLATAVGNVGEIRYLRGDLDLARQAFETAAAIHADTANAAERAYILSWLARVHTAAGEWDEAERWYRTALDAQLEIGARGDAAATRIDLAGLRHLRGDHDLAVRLAREAEATLLSMGLTSGAVLAKKILALSLLAQGELDEARGLADAAENHAEFGDIPSVRRHAGMAAARVAAASREPAEVEAAARRLEAIVAETTAAGLLGSAFEARFHLGVVELEAGREAAWTSLAALADDAADQGFGGIVRRVERLRVND